MPDTFTLISRRGPADARVVAIRLAITTSRLSIQPSSIATIPASAEKRTANGRALAENADRPYVAKQRQRPASLTIMAASARSALLPADAGYHSGIQPGTAQGHHSQPDPVCSNRPLTLCSTPSNMKEFIFV